MAARAARAATILLVDDRPENLLALEAILSALDQTLVRASSGEEALKALLTDDFAVILLDVQMPEYSGFEVIRMIREHEHGGTRQTPVVALTAHAMTGDRERCIEAGMDDYVPKPIKRDELFSVIDRMRCRGSIQTNGRATACLP